MTQYIQGLNVDGCFDWGDSVHDPYRIIMEGEYSFRVDSFIRTKFPGNQMIPACNKAVLKLAVDPEDGGAEVLVTVDLILHKVFEWKLSSFFKCIMPHDESSPIRMDWDRVTSARGRAYIKPYTYVDGRNKERTVNIVEQFLPYEAKYFETAPEVMVELDDESPF